MATVTKGRTFVSGETVTPTKLNELVDLATVTSIVDADVSASAAIALSKLATGALPTAITVASANLVDGTIVADDLASGSVTQAKLASGVAATGPAFRAYANSVTSVPNAVNTKINLGAEDFDTANCFASSRFTPNVAGYYWVSAGIRCEALLVAQSILYKNGAPHSYGAQGNVGTYTSVVSDLIYLNGTTDYVELFVYQSAGTTQNVGTQLSPISAFTWMSGFLARAA